MLDPKQASMIRDLVLESLTINPEDASIERVPGGYSIAEVVDALATLKAEASDTGGRALVLEYLGRLVPDLQAGAIDAAGTPSSARLARHQVAATDLLRMLGGETPTPLPRRWIAQRGEVALDLPVWLPLEVLDALARIAEAVGRIACTAPALASEVERQAGEGERARVIIEEVAKLLAALDPTFDGHVTATAVELAARSRCDAGPIVARACGRMTAAAAKAERESDQQVVNGHRRSWCEGQAHGLRAAAQMLREEAQGQTGEGLGAQVEHLLGEVKRWRNQVPCTNKCVGEAGVTMAHARAYLQASMWWEQTPTARNTWWGSKSRICKIVTLDLFEHVGDMVRAVSYNEGRSPWDVLDEMAAMEVEA